MNSRFIRGALLAATALAAPVAARAQAVQYSALPTGCAGAIGYDSTTLAFSCVASGPFVTNVGVQIGTLTGSYSARPTNGAASNGTYLSNSGNINWFGAATYRAYTNAFGNQTTWLGDTLSGSWQAADTYSLAEFIGQPGSGIAVAAATRSQDNTASQSYTLYIYSESDGTLNGTVPGRNGEGAYILAWNRQDPGTNNGTQYDIGIEIDAQNEVTGPHQSPYALNNGSFNGNVLLAAGGDFSNVVGRTQTFTSYAIGLATQNAAKSFFDAGIIAAHNAFLFTHGTNLDMADVILFGQNMAAIWVNADGSTAGDISSIATNSNNAMQVLFNNSGLAFTNAAEGVVAQFTPTGRATFSDRVTATTLTLGSDTTPTVFPLIDTIAGGTRLITWQDASVTVVQAGLRDVPTGGNTGDDWYIDAYDDSGTFLYHMMECQRANGVCGFPQGATIAGGTISPTALITNLSAALSAAGTNQGSAAPLTGQTNIITTCAAGAGVIIPASPTSEVYTVANRGANACLVYPPSGAAIENLSANAAMTLSVGDVVNVVLASSSVVRAY